MKIANLSNEIMNKVHLSTVSTGKFVSFFHSVRTSIAAGTASRCELLVCASRCLSRSFLCGVWHS